MLHDFRARLMKSHNNVCLNVSGHRLQEPRTARKKPDCPEVTLLNYMEKLCRDKVCVSETLAVPGLPVQAPDK